MQTRITAVLVVFAGLFGAAGVAGAALAAHGFGGDILALAAAIALVHAPALLALAAAPPDMSRLKLPCGLLLIAGVLLFSGDLAARSIGGDRLFVNAAPTGGTLLIGGWLLLAVGGVIAALRRPRGAVDAG